MKFSLTKSPDDMRFDFKPEDAVWLTADEIPKFSTDFEKAVIASLAAIDAQEPFELRAAVVVKTPARSGAYTTDYSERIEVRRGQSILHSSIHVWLRVPATNALKPTQSYEHYQISETHLRVLWEQYQVYAKMVADSKVIVSELSRWFYMERIQSEVRRRVSGYDHVIADSMAKIAEVQGFRRALLSYHNPWDS